MDFIKNLVNDGKIDLAVQKIAVILNQSHEDEYLALLENIIETLLTLHGGRTVIRFLIENIVIDVPSLLANLSKRDSLLRYSFLLQLKSICENESDLFLPFSEELLESDDPNVKEAFLQLLIFMAAGEKKIDEKELVNRVISKLGDDKDFVVAKATQALKAMGNQSPDNITKILTKYLEEHPDSNEINENLDKLIKSIVSIDKIKEIVEEEKVSDEELEKPREEIGDKDVVKSQVLIADKGDSIDKSDDIIEKEIDSAENKGVEEEIVKTEAEISDKEKELKKKDLELKKKKLELVEKEKLLEEKEILEKEKALKEKEELLKREQELAKAELELKKKHLEEKEQKIREEETKRIQDQLEKIEDKESEDIE